jgi:S1-C subfamily serine protease
MLQNGGCSMKNSITTALILLVAGLWVGPQTPYLIREAAIAQGDVARHPEIVAEPALESLSQATEALAARVLRSTVHFFSTRTDSDGKVSRGTGTGFVLDAARGLVVTNNHVVGAEDAVVRVRLNDGRVLDATVVGVDPKTDLAVVRIPEGEALHQLKWGDSDLLKPGTWVMAVGNPLGEIGTTSLGVISGLNRTLTLPSIVYANFLQFDAYIDRGSSGGPLVNMAGEVVGINTAISGQVWQGAGYAVPSQMARSIVKQLITNQSVSRGYLGVQSKDVSSNYATQVGLSRPYGARVTKVIEDSPADQAGLRRGDILLAVDGKEISTHDELRARISTTAPGRSVEFKVWRDRKAMRVQIVLAELE